MKKIALLLTIITLFSISSFAQFGVKAGMNFAKMTNLDESTLNNFQAGIFWDKDLIPLIDFRVGFDYSPKGGSISDNNSSVEVQLNYLELPVMAKLKLGPVYALGGIYGAYAMSGTTTVNILGNKIEKDIDFDDVSHWDAGMKFGLGFQLKLGPVGAFVQTGYSFGFVDLNKENSGNELKNTGVLSFSVGILFGNGK